DGGHLLLRLRGQPHHLRLAQRGEEGGGEKGKGHRTGGPETEAGRKGYAKGKNNLIFTMSPNGNRAAVMIRLPWKS
ncbi:hypothetical protein KKA14_11095, partial [bacterium]|nr:hypothetical protein [bacterium]